MLAEIFDIVTTADMHHPWNALYRLATVQVSRRHSVYPLWQPLLLINAVALVGWQLERRIRQSKTKKAKDFDAKLDERKLLSALAIAQYGKQKVSASVEMFGSSYTLNIATETTDQPKTSEQHHFTSLNDFLHFLEEKTILRAGDFK